MGKDLLVTLEDKPGEGARLGEALGNAGVNIEGICAITHEGTATVHILVEDVAGARAALEGAGVKVEGETDVIVADLTANVSTPGTFGMMARKLADAGINVIFAYLATGNRAVVATSDNARAKQILGV
ncbi:MAG TPA: amino acid-binding protein [Actinomycetota bacterium]|nr:amino acid-binding protein [Actinomycetota bacterium]